MTLKRICALIGMLSLTITASFSRLEAAAVDTSYAVEDSTIAVGDHVLSTRFFRPSAKPRFPVVLLAFGSGDKSAIGDASARQLAAAFASRGTGALVFDKRGTGASTGLLTGSDFAALGQDAAALVRYLQARPQVECVGAWGVSQFGWIAPTVVKACPNLCFAILVSPAGVNPHEQVAWFLYRQALSWGLSSQQAAEAERMHRAVALYYAGRSSWQTAQKEVDRHAHAPWFHRVVTHPYWDEMTPEGRILTPDSLARALEKRPGDFEIYRAPSSFVDYRPEYQTLRSLPTMIIYGAEDQLVPIERSRAVLDEVLRSDRRYPHEFRTIAGASHDIQTPDGRFVPEYLTFVTDWARMRFDACKCTDRPK